MKIDKKLLFPYNMAILFVNALLTTLIVTGSSLIFDTPLTWGGFGESFLIGYIILWVLNLKIIGE